MNQKQIKLVVQKACAKDPGLSDAICVNLGFTPRWSKLNAVQLVAVWLAYRCLTLEIYAVSGTPYADALQKIRELPEFEEGLQ